MEEEGQLDLCELGLFIGKSISLVLVVASLRKWIPSAKIVNGKTENEFMHYLTL